uniref:Uncharacterized protein n=1 Tax=Arundo donax TaxID=35708 RepID=A0A0A9A8A3_ARUDO
MECRGILLQIQACRIPQDKQISKHLGIQIYNKNSCYRDYPQQIIGTKWHFQLVHQKDSSCALMMILKSLQYMIN